jgi:hypothetical protein
VPLDPSLLTEAQHRHSGLLGSVVGHAHRRSTAPGNDDIELTHDPQARQRGIGDERQAFTVEVVDDRQNPETSAVGERIRQEVETPALVGVFSFVFSSSIAFSRLASETSSPPYSAFHL